MPYPTIPDFVSGAQATADFNAYIADPLRWLGGDPGGESRPMWRVRSSVNVSMTLTPAWNDISFDTIDIGKGPTGLEWFDIGDPTHLLITQDCVAHIGGCGKWPNLISNKALRLILNDDTDLTLVEEDNVGVSWPAMNRANVSTIWEFVEGDTITMQMYQDSGVTTTSEVEGRSSPVMWAMWIASPSSLIL